MGAALKREWAKLREFAKDVWEPEWEPLAPRQVTGVSGRLGEILAKLDIDGREFLEAEKGLSRDEIRAAVGLKP